MEFLEGLLSLIFFISFITLIVFGVKTHKAHKSNKPKKHLLKYAAISLAVVMISSVGISALQGSDQTPEETLPTINQESTLEDQTEQVETTTKETVKETTTESLETTETTTESTTAVTTMQPVETTENPVSENLSVHYIDVGQGDAILIQQGENAMLIDAGGNSNGPQVVSYIKGQGITRLEYVIGTHPHEDHIGGLDNVINSFEIGKVILPDIIHTTKTFEDVLVAIQSKGLKITKAVAGNTYTLGSAAVEIVGPISFSKDDLNNASVVCRIDYGSNSFLFTGDAEKESESKIQAAGYDISADVLKVGHHGSDTSSSEAFLVKVQPKHAVIMVGTGNTYGHPTAATLERLGGLGVNVYRTDLSGTIVITSDGSNISVNKSPNRGTAPVQVIETQKPEPTSKPETQPTITETTTVAPVETTAPPAESGQYIGNINTKKFHLPSCNSLPDPENQIILNSRQEAIDQGYEACKRCKP